MSNKKDRSDVLVVKDIQPLESKVLRETQLVLTNPIFTEAVFVVLNNHRWHKVHSGSGS